MNLQSVYGCVYAARRFLSRALIPGWQDIAGARVVIQGFGDVEAFKSEHGTVVGMPDTMTITNTELLEIDCDILIPAALIFRVTESAHLKTAQYVEYEYYKGTKTGLPC